MNIKSLIISLAIILSPAIQAGPTKWIKDNAVPIAIGVAGVSAAVIYMTQSDDNTVEEISNHSPTGEHPTVADQYMLSVAKRQAANRPTPPVPINLEPCPHEITISFSADKVPGKSCLKGSRKKELDQKK
jgi:hypothetical protein